MHLVPAAPRQQVGRATLLWSLPVCLAQEVFE